jgi:hypothetical protein
MPNRWLIAIPSPILIAQVRERTGDYTLALHVIAVSLRR